MVNSEVSAFLSAKYVGVFVTTRPDGSPHVAPVWYEYEPPASAAVASHEALASSHGPVAASHGTFRVCTDPGSVKMRNLARRGGAGLCVATHEPPYRYVYAEGRVTVESSAEPDSGPHRLLRRLAVRYLGEEAGNRYADSLRGEALASITLVADRLKWYHEG